MWPWPKEAVQLKLLLQQKKVSHHLMLFLLLNGMPRSTPNHSEEQLLLSKFGKYYKESPIGKKKHPKLWSSLQVRMIWSFPSTPLVNKFQLPESTALAVTIHCCWIRPEGFLHLGSVTQLLTFWGCAKCSSLPFALEQFWAHGIWLKTLHGNAVSKMPLSCRFFL